MGAIKKSKEYGMKFRSLIIAPVLLSLIACSKDKASPVKEDPVALELSAVKAENLEDQLETIQKIILTGNLDAAEIVYLSLKKLEKSYPEDLRIQLFLKLVKPAMMTKGLHRKLDHLVFLADGNRGLWKHMEGISESKHADFLRASKKEEVFKTEKDAQIFLDSLASAYGDLFRFAKANEENSIEILAPNSTCENEYYVSNVYEYSNDATYGEHYYVRRFDEGYGANKVDGKPEAEYFSIYDKDEVNEQIRIFQDSIAEYESYSSVTEDESLKEYYESMITTAKNNLEYYESLLTRDNSKYFTDRVYYSGACSVTYYDYKVEKLDWKSIQAAATGMRLFLSTANAYDLRGGAVLTGMTNYWRSQGSKITEKKIKDHIEIGKSDSDNTYQFLGKLRQENRLNLYKESTSDILSGIQWMLDNDQITCTEKYKKFYGDGICGAEHPEMNLSPSDQVYVFGSVVADYFSPTTGHFVGEPSFAKQDLLDNLAKGLTSARLTEFKVGYNYYLKYFDFRQFFLNPMDDITVLLGDGFSSTGYRNHVEDPSLNGLFPYGDFNDMLRDSAVQRENRDLYGY